MSFTENPRTLTAEGGEFVLHISPRERDRAKIVPGLKFHKPTETWRGPACMATGVALRLVFGDSLELDPSVPEAIRDELSDNATIQACKDQGVPERAGLEGLRDAQRTASLCASLKGGFVIADEKGYGKTVEACGALNLVDPSLVLIVATNSMKFTWKDEVETWCPGRTVAVMGRTKKQREAAAEAVVSGEVDTLVVGWSQLRLVSSLAPYGSFHRTDEEKQPGILNAVQFDVVIADEAHRAKTPKAKQTLALKRLAQGASYRWALTATPIAGNAMDLWSVLNFCDPVSFPSRSKFIDMFLLVHEGFHGGLEDLGLNPATEAEFRKLWDPMHIRRPLDLSVKMLPVQYRYVEMEGKQLTAYNKIKKDSIAKVDESYLVAVGPLTVNTRLQQLAQATPVLEDVVQEDGSVKGEVVSFSLPSCKYDLLVDVLDEMGGEPLVVFAESRKLLELCQRELTTGRSPRFSPEEVGMITGEVSDEDRHMWVERFQAGELPLILCTIGAGSEGITLTRAHTMLFLNRSYRWVGNNQAEGRLLRHGQTSDVQIIEAITLGSEEMRVHESSEVKEGKHQQLVQDPDHKPRSVPDAP